MNNAAADKRKCNYKRASHPLFSSYTLGAISAFNGKEYKIILTYFKANLSFVMFFSNFIIQYDLANKI